MPANGGDGGAAPTVVEPCTGEAGQDDGGVRPNATTGNGDSVEANATKGGCGGPYGTNGPGGDAYAKADSDGLSTDGNGGAGGSATAAVGTGGTILQRVPERN